MSYQQKYRIRPLKWSMDKVTITWKAETPTGFVYKIVRVQKKGVVVWQVCGMFSKEFDFVGDAKWYCEEHYRNWVEKCLERVD